MPDSGGESRMNLQAVLAFWRRYLYLLAMCAALLVTGACSFDVNNGQAVVGLNGDQPTVELNGSPIAIQLFDPFVYTGVAPATLRVIYIVAGVVLLLVGWRVYDLAVALVGFLVGAGIGVSLLGGNENQTIALAGLVGGGIIGAVLAVALQYVAVFLIGAYVGVLLTTNVFFALTERALDPVFMIIAGVVGGLVMLGMYFYIAVMVTSAVGAVVLAQSL
ncbi:MAG: DUF4203 domain-containing protein, partial [Burkholderiales bacterium]|nr:DUF4203 domain-containing protein [Anaerolineae bacterium]